MFKNSTKNQLQGKNKIWLVVQIKKKKNLQGMAAVFPYSYFSIKCWLCRKKSPVLSFYQPSSAELQHISLINSTSAEMSSKAGRSIVGTKLYKGVKNVLVQICKLFT